MNNKSLIILAAVAVVLGVTAYFLNGGAKSSAPKLNGKAVLPELDASAVAKIEVGGKLVLAAGDKGWTVETYHGYPASREKIAENLLKLGDLKVGQVVRGKALDATTPVVLRDAAGKELANLALGPKHAKWGHGRYAKFEGETVLISDTLDAFEGDAAKQWIETKVVDEPWISFNDIADAKLTEADFGLLGCTAVILLFLAFAFAGMRIAVNCPHRYGSLLAAGLTAMITLQAALNIAVVIGVMPTTGLPLPFFSAGGTSVTMIMAAVGILLNISRENGRAIVHRKGNHA